MTSTLPLELTDKHGRPFRARWYRPSDRDHLERMYLEFEPKRGAQGLPPGDAKGVHRWLDRVLAAGEHVLVEVGSEVVGHAMLIPLSDGGGAELANFLHQSVRNRGIGTALNRLVIDLARQAGYSRVWLSVEPSNRAAVRSYQYAGFRPLPGSILVPEIEMEVRLNGR